MNRTLTRVKTQLAEEFQIARLPGSHALSYASVLRVEMLRPTGKPRRHRNTCLLERCLGDITQESLVKRLQGLFRIGQHVPGSRLTLIHTEVIVRVHQRTCQS